MSSGPTRLGFVMFLIFMVKTSMDSLMPDEGVPVLHPFLSGVINRVSSSGCLPVFSYHVEIQYLKTSPVSGWFQLPRRLKIQ